MPHLLPVLRRRMTVGRWLEGRGILAVVPRLLETFRLLVVPLIAGRLLVSVPPLVVLLILLLLRVLVVGVEALLKRRLQRGLLGGRGPIAVMAA